MIVSVVVGANLDKTAVLLPMTAIHQGRSTDELVVFEVVSESGHDVIRTRKVSLGGVYNNQVEVLNPGSEVRPGSRIAVTTSERLTDGTLVRVMPESTDSAMALREDK